MSDPNTTQPSSASLEASFAGLVLASVVLAAGGVGLYAFSAASAALAHERAEARAALAEAKEEIAVELLRAHAEEAAHVGASLAVRAALGEAPVPGEAPTTDQAASVPGPSAPAPAAPPATAPASARAAAARARDELVAIRPSTPFDAIAIAGSDGEILASTVEDDRLATLLEVARAIDGPRWTNLREDRTGRARYDLAVPIRVQGRVAGFALAEVRADRVMGVLVERARLGDAGDGRVEEELRELEVEESAGTSEGAEDPDALDEPKRQALLATFGLAVVAIAASFALVRTLTAPLARLADAARNIAEGNLREPPPTVRRNDELGRLSSAITAMHAGLRSAFGSLRDGIRSLADHADEVRSSARKYANAAEAQSTAVASTSSSLVETKKSSASTASTARVVLEATEAAVAAGRRGLDRIDEGVEAMNAIEDRVRGIATEALELSQQSARIGQIVATVNDLSEQSNVLAVNASVEAAKAGDRGRGFAVVAGEVRRLAEQSKRATLQIRQILGEVQRAVESVVMAAEEGTKRSEDGRRTITEIRTTVHELASALEQNAESARRISASAADQAAGIAQLSSALESIVETGGAAAREVRTLEGSAAALTDLGEELEALAKRFRV